MSNKNLTFAIDKNDKPFLVMRKIQLLRLISRAAENLGNSEIAIMHLIDKFEAGEICAAAARRAFRGGLWSAFVIDSVRFNNLVAALAAVEPAAADSWRPVDMDKMSEKYFDYFVY